jgi:hypothetical protein
MDWGSPENGIRRTDLTGGHAAKQSPAPVLGRDASLLVGSVMAIRRGRARTGARVWLDATASAHHDAQMRTTVDLPEDLHRIVSSIALHTQRSLSQTVAELMRRGLSAQLRVADGSDRVAIHPRTGLPVVRASRTITPEDVRALDDEA